MATRYMRFFESRTPSDPETPHEPGTVIAMGIPAIDLSKVANVSKFLLDNGLTMTEQDKDNYLSLDASGNRTSAMEFLVRPPLTDGQRAALGEIATQSVHGGQRMVTVVDCITNPVPLTENVLVAS